MHKAFVNLILISRFNIIQKCIHLFYNTDDVFTEDGYHLFKKKYLHKFKTMLNMLDDNEKYMNFDLNTIV